MFKNEIYTYHFTGKFKALINGAGKGFCAMLYGKPGSGKSTFALQLANYLSTFGKVLYVSNEETRYRLGELEPTNSLKINAERQNINFKNKNIRWANDFRGIDLAEYEFVFMDSFQTLQMTKQELEKLKHQYVDTAFIYVFQSTKGGQFRGNQTLAHNIDALIHVTEKHTAYNHKRYAGEAYSPETAIDVFE